MFSYTNIVNALSQSIWQFSLILLFYYLCKFLIKNKKTVYSIAVTLQFLGFAWFLKTIFFHNSNFTPLNNSTTSGFISSNLFSYIGFIYIIIVGILLIRLSIKFSTLQKQQNHFIVYDKIDELYSFIKPYLANKNVVIKISNAISSPITYGFFKPIIVLPFSLCNSLTNKEMEMVLLHEIAHILRNDYAINLLLKVVDTFLFFNPFSKILLKEIEQEREFCCDDWVLKKVPENLLYAQTLFAVAKHHQTQKTVALVQAFAQPHYLLQRIKRVTKTGVDFNKLNTKQVLIMGFVLLISLSTSFFANNPSKAKQTITQTTSKPDLKNLKKDKKTTKAFSAVKNTKTVKKLQSTYNSFNSKKVLQTTKYTSIDKQRLKDGFQFLSELAKENVVIKNLIETNPTLQSVNINTTEADFDVTKAINAKNTKPTQASRYFYLPASKTSKAKMITITVVEKDNNDKKVIIDIEEIEASQRS